MNHAEGRAQRAFPAAPASAPAQTPQALILQALLKSVQHAIVVLDGELRVVLSNDPAQALFGASDPLEGASWPDLAAAQDAGGGRLLDAITRVRATRAAVHLERLAWADCTLDVHVAPLGADHPEGRVRGIVLVAEDVTRRERLKSELFESARLVALGSLIGGVAHEINNPLAAVLGYAELLLVGELPDAVREDVRIIHREADRCRHILEGLIVFARRHAPRRELVDLNQIVRDTLELMAYDLRTSAVAVCEELDFDTGCLVAYRQQLQQVVFNLVANAHQAMKAAGGGTLTIRTERERDILRLWVIDTGPGIPAGRLDRIFDPFSAAGEGQGTGLGLSICHAIVTEHGGRIYVVSHPGEGATFVVELPVRGVADPSSPFPAPSAGVGA